MFNVLWVRTFEGLLQEIGALNLDVFYLRNFRYVISLSKCNFFHYCNSLKTLYVVHPKGEEDVFPPYELKKLVIYCPKSSKNDVRFKWIRPRGYMPCS